MKKIYFIAILITLSAAIISCAKKPEKGAWEKVFSRNIKHSHFYDGFSTETNGITVGYGGKCYYTEDGGQSWKEAVNESACRFGMDINGEKTAWHCGNGENINYTEDGGKTWIAIDLPEEAKSISTDASPMSVINADKNGRIIFITNKAAKAEYRISAFISSDKGNTWKEEIIEAGAGYLFLNKKATLLTHLGLDGTTTLFKSKSGF